jgi:hypothetical protein
VVIVADNYEILPLGLKVARYFSKLWGTLLFLEPEVIC